MTFITFVTLKTRYKIIYIPDEGEGGLNHLLQTGTCHTATLSVHTRTTTPLKGTWDAIHDWGTSVALKNLRMGPLECLYTSNTPEPASNQGKRRNALR